VRALKEAENLVTYHTIEVYLSIQLASNLLIQYQGHWVVPIYLICTATQYNTLQHTTELYLSIWLASNLLIQYRGHWVVPIYLIQCLSMLQCVAVCCRRLSSTYLSNLQCVAGCCCVLQCVAECCSVLQCVAVWDWVLPIYLICIKSCEMILNLLGLFLAERGTRDVEN